MAKDKKKVAGASPKGGKGKGDGKGDGKGPGGGASMDKATYAEHLERLELELNAMARWLRASGPSSTPCSA